MYELKGTEMIFVFTGPDGSGRKTIADMVGSTLGIRKVLSYTTRERRPVEEEGQDYHFISREQFLAAKAAGEFLEEVEISGNLYGIKHQDIANQFQASGCIYVILNAEGARKLKQLYGERVRRFFIYADRETVKARQKARGDTPELIERHMSHYDSAMAYMEECKYSYENIDLAHTVFSISNVIETYLDRNLIDLD
jgi:guanylate kinase